MKPLVSYICVTNRSGLARSVQVQFEAQEHPHKELVVVDASEEGNILKGFADLHVRAEPGTLVGPMRNAGLDVARGRFIFWFDDDDWRHPEIVSRLMREMRENDHMAGLPSVFWIDLLGGMRTYGCNWWPIFAATLYRMTSDIPRFRQVPANKTDSYWLNAVFKARGRTNYRPIHWPKLYVWVRHGKNLSNPDFEGTNGIKEDSKDFFPKEDYGLKRHMEIVREAFACSS